MIRSFLRTTRARRALIGATSIALVGGLTLGLAPAVPAAPVAPGAVAASRTITVGSLTLTRCNVAPGAYCGSIERPWGSGVAGTVTIGFAYVPASNTSKPVLGTLVAQAGGPGQSSTVFAESFLDTYGSLAQRRDLLLVDQRGTGRSEAIRCSPQDCPKTLGKRTYAYGTEAAADDLAAVLDALNVETIDLYGVSYGTFFSQVFAGRHGDRLRTLILDSAYPVYGESAWFPTQGPALNRAYDVVCKRSPLCASQTSRPRTYLERLLRILHRDSVPVNAPAADGRRHTFRITAVDVSVVAHSATYGYDVYREFTAAARAALGGDWVPLGRLVADQYWSGGSPDPVSADSPGLNFSVSCRDYPQVFDLSQPIDVRRKQLSAALRLMKAERPDIYAPFTIQDMLNSWLPLDYCLRAPQTSLPVGPPRPIGGAYPDVPTMILSGELDTITTAAEGAMVKGQFPNSRQIVIANESHHTAAGQWSCGAMIVRYVVQHANTRVPQGLATCGRNAIRAVGTYSRTWTQTQLPANVSDTSRNHLASAVLATLGDTVNHWYASPLNNGLGLRGGTWSSRLGSAWIISLDGVKLMSDLPVSGTVRVDLNTGVVTANATVDSDPTISAVTASWNLWGNGERATVTVTGTSGNQSVVKLLAP